MMDKDKLGYTRRRGSNNLGELTSGEYLTFGALIWHGKLTCLPLLLPTGFETMDF